MTISILLALCTFFLVFAILAYLDNNEISALFLILALATGSSAFIISRTNPVEGQAVQGQAPELIEAKNCKVYVANNSHFIICNDPKLKQK